MRVVISGAGAVGRYLASDLAARGHEVLLIEQDPATLGVAKEWAPDVGFLLGDACEPWVLEKAELKTADVVVAATGDDEDNLVVSLLAKTEFAVPRVIARVNHPKNEWLFNENWGVDLSVSTPHLITALVEEAVTVGRLVRLLQFEGGQARLVEVTLADDSPVVDKAISEVDVPRDATFVAVVREEHVVMPRGDTVFQAGDEVLAMVTPDSEEQVRHMLTGLDAYGKSV
jgi:trk system potassium uptake protein TrkA